MELDQIFVKLWEDYAYLNPSVQKVKDLFTKKREQVLNDHIAFRTFDHPLINLEILSKPFTEAGYVEKGQYHFKEKHLFAKHYEHKENKEAPRVFISQLLVHKFSKELQQTIKESIESVPSEAYASDDLLFKGRLWDVPEFETYSKLRAESEYAAWLYVFGFRANHFTVNVNYLKKYDSIEKVNDLLKLNGFLINNSGGEIKGSPAELLEQSSIKSEIIKIQFKEGIFDIPGCYYEFAKRYPDENGNIYSGFIAKSADKIFESTNFYKKKKD